MSHKSPKHLSYNFALKMEDLPTKQPDRLSLLIILPAIFFGLIMASVGLFDFINGEGIESYINAVQRKPLINPMLIDIILMAVGTIIVGWAIVANMRYKKIFFNGRVFSVDIKGVFGEVEMFREHLRNYNGVHMRMEFFQYGLLPKHKYIIELEHQDPQKTIPLYISLSSDGIYDIWSYYARMLNKPTLIETEEGLVYKEVYDLNKNFREYFNSNGIEVYFDKAKSLPADISVVQKSDRVIIQQKSSSWDIASIIGAIWLSFYTAIMVVATQKLFIVAQTQLKMAFLLFLAWAILLVFAMFLFKKDKIVVRQDKIILTHKFLFLYHRVRDIQLQDIKDIQILQDAATDRHYLAIVSRSQIIVFGKKMPLESLQWIKNFVINQIIE